MLLRVDKSKYFSIYMLDDLILHLINLTYNKQPLFPSITNDFFIHFIYFKLIYISFYLVYS